MKLLFFSFLFLFTSVVQAQSVGEPEVLISTYLDSIREETAELTAFFSEMPKGGDLHHHFTGSVYAETYLEVIEEQDYWINTETLAISPTKPRRRRRDWERISELQEVGLYLPLRRRLMQRWSILDYPVTDLPPDQQFFNAFVEFAPAVLPTIATGLRNMKERALAENVLYIETMFTGVLCAEDAFSYPEPADKLMWYIQEQRDESGIFSLFDILFEDLKEGGMEACAAAYNQRVRQWHDSLQMETEHFVMRYQNYVLRTKSPSEVFADLALNFASAATSPLIVGVNIVAPEHHPTALRDYWLHMQMYRYLSEKYPKVKKALHAGELAPGQVPPEHLNWHIQAAVAIADADRIGHGVDLPYEKRWPALLDTMRQRDIPVEINLSSNEFLLGIAGEEHPISLFHDAGIPLVISTDDAGVLRTSLTEQYVLLAREYPEFSYAAIKKLVYNSLTYSFIEEDDLRRSLAGRLDRQFADFEASILSRMRLSTFKR